MRLFPAHLREAKQMARDLCDAFEYLNTPRDWTDPQSPPPTLQQSQELMAKAMGYAGWRELSGLVKQPHAAIYLDTMETDKAGAVAEALATRLSAEFGIDYAHGQMVNALDLAGVGYSPKVRRSLAESSTPWGVIMEEDEPIAEGIRSVSTGSHGGWLLSDERQARVPEHLRNAEAAYEEDGEFYLVAIAFPSEAESFGVSLRSALEYLDVICPSSGADTDPEKIASALVGGAADGSADLRNVPSRRRHDPPVSEMDVRVVAYLAECVRVNRLPVRFPTETPERPTDPLMLARAEYYTLEEWVALLSCIPAIEGSWATRPGPWFDHWDWRYREAQRAKAYAAYKGYRVSGIPSKSTTESSAEGA